MGKLLISARSVIVTEMKNTEKNKELFDIRQDLSIDKEAKATILTEKSAR